MCEQAFAERGYVVTVRDRRLAAPVATTERVLVHPYSDKEENRMTAG